MIKPVRDAFEGIHALPAFPVVLVIVERNIMIAAVFSFFSLEPPCVMVGVVPDNLSYELISAGGEFGINTPVRDQLDAVRLCGSLSGRVADKLAKAGLKPQSGNVISSLLVVECLVDLECRVVHQVPFQGSLGCFFGQIEAVYCA